MIQSVVFFIGLVIAFLVGLFLTKKTSQENAQVLDLTNKIKANQAKSVATQADADKAIQEYQDALKKYDPTFHGDDDPTGKPSA